VLGTNDAGMTWTRLLDGHAIAALTQQSAARSGDAAQRKAADRIAADGADKPLLDLVVFSASQLFVVGAYGMALETSDAGKTWTLRSGAMENPKGLHLYAVRRNGPVIAIAGEQGLFLRSDDAGLSFRTLPMPYKGSFFTLELASEKDIVVAGMRGNVWRSADAGSTWRQLALPFPAAITGSSLLEDGTVVLASQSGQLFTARSSSLEALKVPPLPPLTGVLPISGDTFLALSLKGVHLLPPAGPHKTN
jgi:photosystem II stability/assembly factor-like uncharacterized protein